jgi:uncharacterized membrane protein YkoI
MMVNMRWLKHFLAGALCASLLVVAAVVADDEREHQREHDEIRAALQRGEVLPLTQILSIAQQQVPGDVIEVELESKRGALIYEIKVLTQGGRVREVKIDARNGKVIKIEDD